MQPGQFLVNKDGQKRKIYFVNEYIVIFEAFAGGIQMRLISSLKEEGWSLIEEPWVPKIDGLYYVVVGIGKEKDGIEQNYWSDDKIDKFRLSMGNVHRTKEDAELYKQKLIETMGIKT